MVWMVVLVCGAIKLFMQNARSNIGNYFVNLIRKLDESCEFGRLKKLIIFPSEVKISRPTKPPKFFRRSTKKEKEIQGRKDSNANLTGNNSPSLSTSGNDNVEIRFALLDEDKVPVVAIVNKLSGGQVGADVLKSFYRYLNPIQVIDLIDEGLEKLRLFRQFKRVKVLVGGGDGTIGSVLTYISEPSFREDGKFKMSVAVLPLGTGNDLSNTNKRFI